MKTFQTLYKIIVPTKNVRREESPTALEAERSDKGKTGGRQQWANSTEFLLSCVSMSVGLGNVWRFPFTAYENGGGGEIFFSLYKIFNPKIFLGAFLIPYLVVLLLVGRPLYLLELGLGQFCSGGCVKVEQYNIHILKLT